MAIVKIEEVFVYTSIATADNPIEGLEVMAAMDHSGIPFTKLIYNDPEQNKAVFDSVNTWWCREPHNLDPVTKFPFVVYTEVHDSIPARHSPVKYKSGIQGTQEFISFFNSVMNKP